MNTQQKERKLYTPREVCELFQISRVTFGEWCRKGHFQKITIPGQRRIFVTSESVDKILSGSHQSIEA